MNGRVSSALLGLLLAACSSTDSSLESYVAQVKQRPPRPVTPLPDFRSVEPATGPYLRDPFQPIAPQPAPPPDASTRFGGGLSPLAAVDAAGLELIRSYWDLDQPAALVQTNTADLYRLKLGDQVGQFVVSAIDAERLTLVDGRGTERIISSKPGQ